MSREADDWETDAEVACSKEGRASLFQELPNDRSSYPIEMLSLVGCGVGGDFSEPCGEGENRTVDRRESSVSRSLNELCY